MSNIFEIKDNDSQESIKVILAGDYLDVEFKGSKLAVRKQVYIYTDFPALIQYFENVRLGIESKRTDIARWASIEDDFVLVSKFTNTGNVNISAALQDLEENWSTSIGLTLALSDIDGLLLEMKRFS
ncbi:MAG: hypothetical protein KDD61_13575 [Bdellovibrionales bacterium]|nr:hypothetical protein [Bdellovibrionales bacterium]